MRDRSALSGEALWHLSRRLQQVWLLGRDHDSRQA